MTVSQRGGVDCHAHVFTRALPRIAEARYAPERDALPDEYLRLLDAHGLAGVLVQPSFLGTDNTYMLDAVAQAPERLRAIAVVAANVAGTALDRLAVGGTVGIRLNLIGRGGAPLDAVAPPALLREMARRNWLVEVQAEGPHWPDLLPALIASGARIVIDHFGRPTPALGAACPGFQAILKAARNADIWVKLSAPYRFAPRHAAACAALLSKALGAHRLVWGSDWPWTQHPEITDYGATLAWLADWIPDAAMRRRILCDNPRTLFGFG